LFSLAGPVPINNRIIKWTPGSLPSDWKAQEHRWNLYHWLRTCGLVVAFALLVFSIGIRCTLNSFYEKADRCQGTLLGLLLVP
jgi:hypothetical protein